MKRVCLLLVCTLLLFYLSACGNVSVMSHEDVDANVRIDAATEAEPKYSYDTAVSFYELLGNGIKLVDAQLDYNKMMWSMSGYSDLDDIAGPFQAFDKSGTADNLSKLIAIHASMLETRRSSDDMDAMNMVVSCNNTFTQLAKMLIAPKGTYSKFIERYDDEHTTFDEQYNMLSEYLTSVGALETTQE